MPPLQIKSPENTLYGQRGIIPFSPQGEELGENRAPWAFHPFLFSVPLEFYQQLPHFCYNCQINYKLFGGSKRPWSLPWPPSGDGEHFPRNSRAVGDSLGNWSEMIPSLGNGSFGVPSLSRGLEERCGYGTKLAVS